MGKARMCDGVFRVEVGDAHPIFERFFSITLFEEEVACTHGRIDCCPQVTKAFGELRNFFHRHRIVGCVFGDA